MKEERKNIEEKYIIWCFEPLLKIQDMEGRKMQRRLLQVCGVKRKDDRNERQRSLFIGLSGRKNDECI